MHLSQPHILLARYLRPDEGRDRHGLRWFCFAVSQIKDRPCSDPCLCDRLCGLMSDITEQMIPTDRAVGNGYTVQKWCTCRSTRRPGWQRDQRRTGAHARHACNLRERVVHRQVALDLERIGWRLTFTIKCNNHVILCCPSMGPEGRVDLVRLRGFCGYGMNTVFLRRSPMVC